MVVQINTFPTILCKPNHEHFLFYGKWYDVSDLINILSNTFITT